MVVLKEIFSIEPVYFDGNFVNHVKDIVERTRIHTCTKKVGYINSVKNIKILNNTVSMINGNANVLVEYTARVTKPEIGQFYNSFNVLCVVDDRVLVDVDGMFSLVIKNVNVLDGKCSFHNCKCVFSIDDGIEKILLKMVDYKEGKFMAIGEHVCDN